MNQLLAIPFVVRLGLVFVLGTVAGGLINWCVYSLAWNRRAISPWSAPPTGARLRGAFERLPVVGWLALRRESVLHGRGFWIRPLVVELFTGLFLAGLYAFELGQVAVPWAVRGAAPAIAMVNVDLQAVAHAQFFSHALLVCLMLAASLIDLDEKTIPDGITVPGTLVALVVAGLLPWSLLPAGQWKLSQQPAVEFLTLASPEAWPAALDGWPPGGGAALALGCWSLWCGGLMPRVWRMRRGLAMAVRIFVHRLRVERATYTILVIWGVGAAAILLAAWRATTPHWAALVTSLVGMAAGGGIIWAVRVIGSAALGKEAMGFGDVTLMSMIGAFLGWQACLIIFFLAPFFGLALAIANWVMRGDHEIPYGPFLCLAALGVVLRWQALWERTIDVFALGALVPLVIGVCLVMLGVLLAIYRVAVDLLAKRR